MIVLHFLTSGDRYGFELTQLIEKHSGGVLKLTLGSLYPLLYRLEEKGFVSEEERLIKSRLKRIYYHLEEKGAQRLKELVKEYEETHKGIRRILSTDLSLNRD